MVIDFGCFTHYLRGCKDMDKRIVIFSTAYYPVVGGAEVAIKELTDRMSDLSFDLICARLQRYLPDQEQIGNVQVHRVGFGYSFDKYLLPFFGVWKAIRLVPSQPGIWSVLASYAGFAGLFYCWLRPKTRFLLTLQEGDPLEKYTQRLGIFTFLQRALFRRANHVQVISRFLGDWAMREGYSGTVSLIPNGVDIEAFSKDISEDERRSLRAAFGFQSDDVVLITASRLTLKNAVDDVIRALPLLPTRCKFLIVGVGEDEAKLKDLVQTLALESRVVFAGYRSHSDLPKLLRASDVFIRPSLSEGLGNSFLEAMAAEVPIIGTPVGGIPDFLLDGETGLMCQVRQPETIASAVNRLSLEPQLRIRLIKNAAELVRERYDWNRISQEMQSLIFSL